MYRHSSPFTLPSENDVLPASPLISPAACTATLRSPSTESPVSILGVLSNIDALCSTATETPVPILRIVALLLLLPRHWLAPLR